MRSTVPKKANPKKTGIMVNMYLNVALRPIAKVVVNKLLNVFTCSSYFPKVNHANMQPKPTVL